MDDVTDTFSWDTVFALKIDEVNKAIRSSGVSPRQMDQSLEEFHVSCKFSDWEIGPEGDGKLVKLHVPIRECQITFGDKTVPPINDIMAIAEVELDYYEAPPNDPLVISRPTGKFHHLKVKSDCNEGDFLVKTVSIDYRAHGDPGFIISSNLPNVIRDWLNEHIGLFDHIFATVNLNEKADKDAFKWLHPTRTEYAFVGNKSNPKESMLGVLCMTEDRLSDRLIPQLAYNAIPKNAKAGFLIAQERMMMKMIIPSISTAFQGLTIDDFKITDEGKLLTLTSKNKTFPIFNKEDGKTYDTQLNSMQISIKSRQLTMHTETATVISPGIISHCVSDHTYELYLYNLSNGKQSINYREINQIEPIHWVTKDPSISIIQAIEAIILGLILGILMSLTGGLASLAVAIIGGLLLGIIVAIPDFIKLAGTDDAPDISLLLLNITGPIVWTDQENFNLSSVRLNGPLQLGGIFNS